MKTDHTFTVGWRQPELKLGGLVSRQTTTFAATVDVGKFGTFEAEGTATKHKHDDHDEEIAVLLAAGRALQSLGRKLERRGNGLVKHQDDVKKDQLQKVVRAEVQAELERLFPQAEAYYAVTSKIEQD